MAENGTRTADRILDVAEVLAQTRGFNGFSYADVAAELGLTKPALHYHYAGKAELGKALVDRYSARFGAALRVIDSRGGDAVTKLKRYAALYADVLEKQRMCLCGMLAADIETLPEPMRDAVVRFFDDNAVWLERVLADGRTRGVLGFDGRPAEQAQLVVSTLEGAMLVARSYRDPARFRAAARGLVASVAARGYPAHASIAFP